MKFLNLRPEIEFLRDKGLNQREVAEKLGRTLSSIASYCKRHGISGWRKGAAARNQFGQNNPNYTGGISRGTIARRTKEVLNSVGRDLFICERCNYQSTVELPRHHKDRDRRNNKITNLEVLCVTCHNKEHMPERQRDIRGRLICRP